MKGSLSLSDRARANELRRRKYAKESQNYDKGNGFLGDGTNLTCGCVPG